VITLGHITYSNCFPPHAGIITGATAFPYRLVEGIPTQLNRLLSEGGVDVSPSSSIEYARNQDRYVLLPDLSITSKKEVRSIILQSRVPIGDLNAKRVAMTTASATSVVLLRILLEIRYGLRPVYSDFEQGTQDPFGMADAMLFIGDHALRSQPRGDYRYLYDLGRLWYEFTGLPFVFALWQVNYKKDIDKDLGVLYHILGESKQYGLSRITDLAKRYAGHFELPEQLLADYWLAFSYHFGMDERRGLMAFFRYAADLGVIRPVSGLEFWENK
jgi:chorismate dehydratase